MELLEVEYLLLTLDFGKILFLLAAFGSLQAALLKVFEPCSDGGTFYGPRRMTAVLWRPEGENKESLKKLAGLRLQSLTTFAECLLCFIC